MPETHAPPKPDHDSIYRLLFGQPRVIEDLLRGFASSAVGDLLDLASLKQVAARHVSEGLQQSENDMIWEVRRRQGGPLYVYVMLEFQSSPDWTMPLRMANYVGQFYRSLLARPEIRRQRRLPQVLPIVIYSGKGTWSAAEEVNQLIDRTVPGLVPYGLHMRYLLVDTLRSPGLSRALENVADSMFRLQRAETLAEGGTEVRLLQEWLAGEEWAGLRRVLTRWIMKVLLPAKWQPEEALAEDAGLAELSAMLEGEMRTWEDNFREAAEAQGLAQGLTQGRAEGRTEGRTEGMTEGMTKGRTEILVRMARHKFGAAPAAEMATLLKTFRSGEALDAAGVLLLTCHTDEELLARIREI